MNNSLDTAFAAIADLNGNVFVMALIGDISNRVDASVIALALPAWL
jgi:hypothetical protein